MIVRLRPYEGNLMNIACLPVASRPANFWNSLTALLIADPWISATLFPEVCSMYPYFFRYSWSKYEIIINAMGNHRKRQKFSVISILNSIASWREKQKMRHWLLNSWLVDFFYLPSRHSLSALISLQILGNRRMNAMKGPYWNTQTKAWNGSRFVPFRMEVSEGRERKVSDDKGY